MPENKMTKEEVIKYKAELLENAKLKMSEKDYAEYELKITALQDFYDSKVDEKEFLTLSEVQLENAKVPETSEEFNSKLMHNTLKELAKYCNNKFAPDSRKKLFYFGYFVLSPNKNIELRNIAIGHERNGQVYFNSFEALDYAYRIISQEKLLDRLGSYLTGIVKYDG